MIYRDIFNAEVYYDVVDRSDRDGTIHSHRSSGGDGGD